MLNRTATPTQLPTNCRLITEEIAVLKKPPSPHMQSRVDMPNSMNDPGPRRSSAASGQRSSRRFACDRCRTYKARCERNIDAGASCERCLKARLACTTSFDHELMSSSATSHQRYLDHSHGGGRRTTSSGQIPRPTSPPDHQPGSRSRLRSPRASSPQPHSRRPSTADRQFERQGPTNTGFSSILEATHTQEERSNSSGSGSFQASSNQNLLSGERHSFDAGDFLVQNDSTVMVPSPLPLRPL